VAFDPFYQSRAWRETREAFLKANPVCSVPYCSSPALRVDHKKTRKSGGAEFAWSNLQGFCVTHHNQKTARNDRPGYRNTGKPLAAIGCDKDGIPRDRNHVWLRPNEK
jgi:5-methylcytosine-specific restriction endonuclease McrA